MQVSEKLRPLFVRWQFPGSNVFLCMESVPLRGIPARTLRYREKEKPSECGGLLWGTVLPENAQKLILISQAEFIPSETVLFNSSPIDLLALSAALARPKAGLRPIGYFRSNLGSQPFLREQEKTFIERSLPDPDSIFLIVSPKEDGTCVAHFIRRENGFLQESHSLEVPLLPVSSYDCEELPQLENEGVDVHYPDSSKPENVISGPPAHALHDSTLNNARQLAPADQYDWRNVSGNRRTSWRRYAAAAGFVTALGLSVYSFRMQLFPARTHDANTVASEIGLQVSRRSDGQLDLTWNKELAAIQSARGAVLSIKDGPFSREIQMPDDQLRLGKLVYFPESTDIQFHLEILLDQKRSFGESVRVISHDTYLSTLSDATSFPREDHRAPVPVRTTRLATDKVLSVQTGAPPPASPQIQLEAVKQAPPTAHPDTPERNPVPDPARPSPPAVAVDKAMADATTVAGNRVLTPAPTSAPSSANVIPATLSTGPATVDTNHLPVKFDNSPKALSTPAVQEAPATESPKLPSDSSSTAGAPPLVTSNPVFIPPQPIKQVIPNTKPFGTSLITADTDLDILVAVDELGRVVQARPLNSQGSKHSLLTSAALDAARRWKFIPAQRGGARAYGTYVIQFRFRRPK